ncbi:hypothetical protein R3P38DRAFT_3190008 [Favolaschia claudopus]|uniref:Uncharacterized protein n=1 Tax=Favolaschia claudopus TaxID=2862362 RepID=A0AAW0BQ51_9AGAR
MTFSYTACASSDASFNAAALNHLPADRWSQFRIFKSAHRIPQTKALRVESLSPRFMLTSRGPSPQELPTIPPSTPHPRVGSTCRPLAQRRIVGTLPYLSQAVSRLLVSEMYTKRGSLDTVSSLSFSFESVSHVLDDNPAVFSSPNAHPPALRASGAFFGACEFDTASFVFVLVGFGVRELRIHWRRRRRGGGFEGDAPWTGISWMWTWI